MIRVKDWLKLADEPNCSFNEMPPVVREAVDIPVPAKGQGLEGVLKSIDEYLAHSVRTHHPGFMNPFWGGFDRAAFAGELMSLLTQTSMYTYELSPVASLIEQELMKKMCDMASLSEKSTGVLTTGGSNGNMLGLLCARQNIDPDTLRKGSNGQ